MPIAWVVRRRKAGDGGSTNDADQLLLRILESGRRAADVYVALVAFSSQWFMPVWGMAFRRWWQEAGGAVVNKPSPSRRLAQLIDGHRGQPWSSNAGRR